MNDWPLKNPSFHCACRFSRAEDFGLSELIEPCGFHSKMAKELAEAEAKVLGQGHIEAQRDQFARELDDARVVARRSFADWWNEDETCPNESPIPRIELAEAAWNAARADVELNEQCPKREDGQHCEHWQDGDSCHDCGAPPMSASEREAQGMEPKMDVQAALRTLVAVCDDLNMRVGTLERKPDGALKTAPLADLEAATNLPQPGMDLAEELRKKLGPDGLRALEDRAEAKLPWCDCAGFCKGLDRDGKVQCQGYQIDPGSVVTPEEHHP